MTKGILQLASSGSEDFFLNGNPQISFYKAVYRRYTNFSIETMSIPFDSTPNFSETVTCTIPKQADLIHKIILSIQLPEVILVRSLNQTLVQNATAEYTTAQTNFANFNTYGSLVFGAYNIIQTELQPINADPNVINNLVNYYFTATIDQDAFTQIKNTLPPQIISNSDIKTFINNVAADNTLSSSQKLVNMNKVCSSFSIYMNSINKSYFNMYIEKFNVYNDVTTERYNFSWIKKIGHYICNYIELEISGQRIDRMFSWWLNIWYELNKNINQTKLYDAMIGNVTLLNGYNRFVKPTYNLYIPLQFSFNRFDGLSLPLIVN